MIDPSTRTGPQHDPDHASWFGLSQPSIDGGLWTLLRFILFGLAIVGGISLALFFTWTSDSLNLKAGQIANRTIKAPRTASFVSNLRTEERRQEAYDDSRNVVMRTDSEVAPAQIRALQQALNSIDRIRLDRTLTSAAKAEQIRAAVEGLSAEDAQSIANLSSNAWTETRAEAERLLNLAYAGDISTQDVAAIKERLAEQGNYLLPLDERLLSSALAQPFVRPNVSVDEDRTKAAREAAARNAEPVVVTVQQSQVIVRDGDPVTKYDIEKLEYFQLLTPVENWQQFAGMVGLLAFLTCAFCFYLYKHVQGAGQTSQLLLLAIVVLVPVIVGRFLLQNSDLRLMFPIAAAVMLLAVLLDFQVAVVTAAFLSLYLGVVAGISFEVVFVSFLSSLAGAALIWRAERTVTFLWSGLAVTLATFISAIMFALTTGNLDAVDAGKLLIYSSMNGALSASLTFLFFSLLGRLFGITTHLQLLELAHPNQPLLNRLAREAPGTYHHSIVVANLAESAVEQIGGDPLFARVAVLYHDVGKVLRPSFFVENQANRANVHDALDPRTSARIIQEHVSDGVRLARKARLPHSIVDVIEQHHGTTLIKYFYTQAVNEGEDVDEREFRYPGPKPRTKEAGVIMLADSVEAAVRAASQSGKLYEEPAEGNGHRRSTRLAEIVESVFRARLEDGQLDDCELTLKQIEQIRSTFISILEGIYHPRIEYPELTRSPSGEPIPQPTPVEASAS